VIVKGTEYFDGKESRYVDYPVTDVLQMMGRAGRPQFDKEGVACIFVEESKKNFYLKFLYNPFPVESCLGPRLADTLNAEIAIGTIASIEECLGYIDWTFFGRRVKNNPSYYGIDSNSDEEKAEFLYQTVMDCLDALKENDCITINEEDGSNSIATTPIGSTSSKFYLNHRTPKQMSIAVRECNSIVRDLWKHPEDSTTENSFSFNLSSEDACVGSILYHLCHIHEFDEHPVRHNEEHLNLALSDSLPWGSSTPGDKKNRKMNQEDLLEIMSEPHTK
jgi:activating signal cointegrator complex subunit 3